ncbi:hypothetical protein O0L34_g8368 [Tuta absoluta]|nr:hypothetical protein O0L34_g8366 [Tuta absoluta]KAJ2944037.1 hypothetical protein O0L34_g8368 [Tuta absoluta]
MVSVGCHPVYLHVETLLWLGSWRCKRDAAPSAPPPRSPASSRCAPGRNTTDVSLPGLVPCPRTLIRGMVSVGCHPVYLHVETLLWLGSWRCKRDAAPSAPPPRSPASSRCAPGRNTTDVSLPGLVPCPRTLIRGMVSVGCHPVYLHVETLLWLGSWRCKRDAAPSAPPPRSPASSRCAPGRNTTDVSLPGLVPCPRTLIRGMVSVGCHPVYLHVETLLWLGSWRCKRDAAPSAPPPRSPASSRCAPGRNTTDVSLPGLVPCPRTLIRGMVSVGCHPVYLHVETLLWLGSWRCKRDAAPSAPPPRSPASSRCAPGRNTTDVSLPGLVPCPRTLIRGMVSYDVTLYTYMLKRSFGSAPGDVSGMQHPAPRRHAAQHLLAAPRGATQQMCRFQV